MSGIIQEILHIALPVVPLAMILGASLAYAHHLRGKKPPKE